MSEYAIRYENNIISIKSKDIDKDIPNIIRELSNLKVVINKLDVKKASLEDVFVKLTGKTILE